jgi:hypothetical protein
MRTFIHNSLVGFLMFGLAGVATAQKQQFTNWPAGTSPQEVGKKIAQNMLPRWIPTKPSVHYAEDSTWYAALEFAKLTNDRALTAALVKRFDPWRTEEPSIIQGSPISLSACHAGCASASSSATRPGCRTARSGC